MCWKEREAARGVDDKDGRDVWRRWLSEGGGLRGDLQA